MFDTSDLSVTGSSFLHLLPEILVERKKLIYNPTLSLPDDDIVYILVVKMNSCQRTTFLLVVNTRSLKLESCGECFGEMMALFEPI
jgi:hypothetical protein